MLIHEDIKKIKGIGDKTAKLFNKLGVNTVEDLLHFYPRSYSSYGEPVMLSTDTINVNSAYELTIQDDFVFKKVRNLSVGSGSATDGKNRVSITFFNCQYYKKDMLRGKKYVFYGKLKYESNRYVLEQPLFYTPTDYHELQKALQPVYSLTKGLSNKIVTKSIKSAIEDGEYPFLYEEYLPAEDITKLGLCNRKEAYINIHFPKTEELLIKSRKRLAFDELFVFLYLIQDLKNYNTKVKTEKVLIDTALPRLIVEKLPYRLTVAQSEAFETIRQDLQNGYVMNRMLQGDVGSGKTIIAFLALFLNADNKYQGVLMAPTEILAIQHFEKLRALISDLKLDFKIELLVGSTSQKNKKIIYEKLAEGEIDIVIGTHALIQDKVRYNNLGLVITDEQHRFGVIQRQTLGEKGRRPHVLVMSATPIPRSLAMVLYGDMHLTVIDEKPSNRLPVKNCVVGTEYRKKAYEFIVKEISMGRQAYIICPMVEDNEAMDTVESVIGYTDKIKKIFPQSIRIAYLHGQMRASDKSKVMEAFASQNIDILVSTTVIEVGIDVPNATVMMIENAERFGLSQLHQLRGRIGRGDKQSYCIFVNSDKTGKNNKRLDVMNRTNDGFEVAREDLKLRGAGDLFGIRQSGDMEFKIADIYEDSDIIISINNYFDELFNEDPTLSLPCHKQLRMYLEENKDKYIDFGSI